MIEQHLLSEKDMDQLIRNIAKQLMDEYNSVDDLLLVGIKTRGVPMAAWIAEKVKEISGKSIGVGSLDINLYRDDLSEVDEQPIVHRTELPFSVVGKGVILTDDVLYTGRTIRAAMDAVMDFGRPRFIKLAVIIDRGFRELPIQADYIGKKIETTSNQNVKVKFKETDGKNEVLVRTNTS